MLHRLAPRPARLAAILALAATAALPAATQAQAAAGSTSATVSGMRYQFTMITGEESEAHGTVTVVGDRARVEMEKGSRAQAGGSGGTVSTKIDESRDWYLLTEGGRRITIVDPDEESYQEMDAASFTGLIGTVMQAVNTFMTMEVEKPSVSVQRVGDGGMVAGRRTERWALVQEFTTNVGMFGKTSREMHRVVTDYWIAPGLTLPDNPLFELVTRGETALAQADKRYVERVARARASLPKGAALRIIVTAASSELSDGTVKTPKVRRMEVSDLAPASVRGTLLEVPRGYQRSEKKGFSLDL
jgi:hypothetical protein